MLEHQLQKVAPDSVLQSLLCCWGQSSSESPPSTIALRVVNVEQLKTQSLKVSTVGSTYPRILLIGHGKCILKKKKRSIESEICFGPKSTYLLIPSSISFWKYSHVTEYFLCSRHYVRPEETCLVILRVCLQQWISACWELPHQEQFTAWPYQHCYKTHKLHRK